MNIIALHCVKYNIFYRIKVINSFAYIWPT